MHRFFQTNEIFLFLWIKFSSSIGFPGFSRSWFFTCSKRSSFQLTRPVTRPAVIGRRLGWEIHFEKIPLTETNKIFQFSLRIFFCFKRNLIFCAQGPDNVCAQENNQVKNVQIKMKPYKHICKSRNGSYSRPTTTQQTFQIFQQTCFFLKMSNTVR